MKIRLSESKLKEIVKETVCNIIEKIPLYEYAVARRKYVDTVFALSRQIVENLCLIRYRTLTNDDTLKANLKQEAYAHIENLVDTDIKGCDSDEGRRRATIKGFDEASVFTKESRLYTKRVYDKFAKEQINPMSNEAQEAIEYVATDAMPRLVEIIATGAYQDIRDFLDTI